MHGAADRQPGRPQAEGEGDRRGPGAPRCSCERSSAERRPERARGASCARCVPGAGLGPRRRRGDHRRVRAGGDEAVLRLHAPVRHRRGAAASAAWSPRPSSTGPSGELDAGCAPRARASRSRTSAGWPRRRCARPTPVSFDGHEVILREAPVDRAAVYVPGGRAPYPSTVVMGVVTARVAGVSRGRRVRPAGPDGDVHPVVLGACRAGRRLRRLPDGRRAGDRGARLRDRVGPARST